MNITQLREKIKNMLNKYQIGKVVDEEDYIFLLNLLENHPQVAIKIGVGIDYITVEKENKFGTKHFMIHRSDGTETDFSTGKCLKKPTAIQKFKMAARRTVAEDIIKFRNEQFDLGNGVLICPLTYKNITKNESHVDHVFPKTFNKLVSKFISQYSIEPSKVKFVEEDGKIGLDFEDKKLAESFRNFHRQNAELRILSGIGNLSLAKLHT